MIDWIEIYSGAISALATACIAWFTITLSRSTKKLWKEATTASEISDRAASAAKQSAENVKALERAHVYALLGGMFSVDHTNPAGAVMMIGNYGRTPAYLEKVCWTSHTFQQGEWKMPGELPRTLVVRKIVAPTTEPKLSVNVPFDCTGTGPIAFCGRAYFRDVFRDWWSTSWAYRLEPSESWVGYSLEEHAELRREQRGG